MSQFSSVSAASTTFTVSITSVYDSLDILDVPRRQAYPSSEELMQLPIQNYRLSQIKYKQTSSGRMYAL